jgi:hypothetical protein
MVFYLLIGPILVVLTGSAAAAAVGRSFRSGLWACAWAIVLGAPLLIAAWLAEALRWYQQGQGTVLDRAGGLGVGVNLGDAVWWPLVFLAVWAVPLGWLARPPGAHGPPSAVISPRRPERRTSRASAGGGFTQAEPASCAACSNRPR